MLVGSAQNSFLHEIMKFFVIFYLMSVIPDK